MAARRGAQGTAIAWLLHHPRDWIYRQASSVEFLDEVTFRTCMTFEFDTERVLPDPPRALPLMVFERYPPPLRLGLAGAVAAQHPIVRERLFWMRSVLFVCAASSYAAVIQLGMLAWLCLFVLLPGYFRSGDKPFDGAAP